MAQNILVQICLHADPTKYKEKAFKPGISSQMAYSAFGPKENSKWMDNHNE